MNDEFIAPKPADVRRAVVLIGHSYGGVLRAPGHDVRGFPSGEIRRSGAPAEPSALPEELARLI